METTTPQGTTLEVLQAYPLDTLQVQYIDTDYKQEVGTLLGLHSLNPNFPGQMVTQITTRYAGMYLQVPLHKVLPILRPFEALVTPLEDGSTPAIEVAKLLTGAEEEDEYTYEVSKGGYGGFTVEADIHGEQVYVLDLRPDWSWMISDLLAEANHEEIHVSQPAAIIDYLRKNHFALPVNGRPLVAGIDFIAK